MIYYIQTYRTDRNIGKGYNEHIKHLPDDCWVCISDHDSNFLTPKFGTQIEEVIQKHGNEYALLSCVTNRLRGLHQLHENKFSECHDMKEHFNIAISRYNDFYSDVEEVSGVAGIVMLFKKSTWEKVGGFVENSVVADTLFNQAIKDKKLGKIGIMKGVYMYHLYRIWAKDYNDAINNINHLLN